MAGPAGYQDQNLLTVAQYLFDHGYSKAAAAGIAGTIAGESGGNPESQGSGGRGLIGWTPASTLPNSAFTGNVKHDLVAQAAQIIVFNQKNDSQFISTLNHFTDPVKAADYYSRQFERPANPLSDVRAPVAQWVFGQLSGTGGSAGPPAPGGSSGSSITSDIFGGIAGDIANPILSSLGVSSIGDFFERAALILFGLALLIIGVIKLGVGGSKSGSGSGGQSRNLFGEDEGLGDPGDEDDAVDDKQLEAMYDKAEREGRALDQQHDRNESKHAIRRQQQQSQSPDTGRATQFGAAPQSVKGFGSKGPGLASEAGAAEAAAPEVAEAAVVAV